MAWSAVLIEQSEVTVKADWLPYIAAPDFALYSFSSSSSMWFALLSFIFAVRL